ncbi:MAG TPA: protease pro-enzyme activation domain-containing protein, partial [Chloroflexota bacterium]|nr:protease pro-enzyme activation domain-containing protein [Chloroflexota bacterium]
MGSPLVQTAGAVSTPTPTGPSPLAATNTPTAAATSTSAAGTPAPTNTVTPTATSASTSPTPAATPTPIGTAGPRGTATPAATSASASTVTPSATVSPTVTGTATVAGSEVPGNVSPLVAGAQLVGHADPAQALHLSFTLAPQNRAELRARISQPERNKSFLSEADFLARYAPASADHEGLVGALRTGGMRVTRTRADRTRVEADTDVQTAERVLQTTINEYSLNGRHFYANATNPIVPTTLAGKVLHIGGLDNALQLRPHLTAGRPASATSPGQAPYAPADIRTAYDMAPLYSAGYTGSGETIGIVTLAPFNLSDVRGWESTYGLPSASISVVHDGTPQGCSTSGGDVETTLDVEWSSALAPGAAVKVFEGADPCDSNFEAAIYDATHDSSVTAISISWGECELEAGSSVLQTIDSYLAYGAATGKSIFVASGDSGSADCSGGALGVDFPASSPNVTGVGGTSLSLTQPGANWSSERAWSGSGGGCSVEFNKPSASWQSSIGACSGRGVPDVAGNANPSTGYLIYYGGGLQGWWGGTSFASPVWAGIMAAINHDRVSHGLSREGPPNIDLYSLGASRSSAFHDITSGSNGAYSAAAGWDRVTGWGSPDSAQLAAALIGLAGPTATPTPGTLTVTASPASVNTGAAITVTWSGDSSGTVGDWLGLFPVGGANSSRLAVDYLSCSLVRPPSPISTGNCTFTMPSTAGSYEF